jgi:hypothetical protein
LSTQAVVQVLLDFMVTGVAGLPLRKTMMIGWRRRPFSVQLSSLHVAVPQQAGDAYPNHGAANLRTVDERSPTLDRATLR